ncbi:MAG: hypothetical protein F6K35_24865 [Okeania sp. SIO2H7]|nr:hypothetical protein [Okeania sp. SIO2H7]
MKSGKRTERVSWIAAINQEKKFAPLTFIGSCNRVWHESWWENCLLPKLQRSGERYAIRIIDVVAL